MSSSQSFDRAVGRLSRQRRTVGFRPTAAGWRRCAEAGAEPDWRQCKANPYAAMDALEKAVRSTEGSVRLRLAGWMMVMILAFRVTQSA